MIYKYMKYNDMNEILIKIIKYNNKNMIKII